MAKCSKNTIQETTDGSLSGAIVYTPNRLRYFKMNMLIAERQRVRQIMSVEACDTLGFKGWTKFAFLLTPGQNGSSRPMLA